MSVLPALAYNGIFQVISQQYHAVCKMSLMLQHSTYNVDIVTVTANSGSASNKNLNQKRNEKKNVMEPGRIVVAICGSESARHGQ